jgi:hypothetical protein
VPPSQISPFRVYLLVVRAIIGDEYSPILSGESELFLIGNLLVRPTDFMHRDCINSTTSKPLRDAKTYVLIEQVTETHPC